MKRCPSLLCFGCIDIEIFVTQDELNCGVLCTSSSHVKRADEFIDGTLLWRKLGEERLERLCITCEEQRDESDIRG